MACRLGHSSELLKAYGGFINEYERRGVTERVEHTKPPDTQTLPRFQLFMIAAAATQGRPPT